ncbi:hypothetical protein ACRAWD_20220 [Caulobacter segnis]
MNKLQSTGMTHLQAVGAVTSQVINQAYLLAALDFFRVLSLAVRDPDPADLADPQGGQRRREAPRRRGLGAATIDERRGRPATLGRPQSFPGPRQGQHAQVVEAPADDLRGRSAALRPCSRH